MHTWRSFGLLQQRQLRLQAAVAEYNKRLFYATFLNRWLGIRVESIGACALFVVGVFVVVFARELDASTAGLAMSQVQRLPPPHVPPEIQQTRSIKTSNP